MPIKIIGSMSAPSCYYKTWNYTNSPRDSQGNLVLTTHATSKQERMCGTYRAGYGEPGLTLMTSGLDVNFGATTRSKAAYAAAYDKFRDKAWNEARASLLVDLAERNKTFSMLGGTMSRILRGARQLRKGYVLDAARTFALDKVPKGTIKSSTFAAFQNNWLAYRYGWLPLVMSANALAETAVSPLPDYYNCRASGSAPLETDVVVTSNQYVQHIIAFRKTRCVIKGQVRVSNPDLANFNQYGLLNVAQAGWELIPFSFVIDWFTNIGNLLEDITSFTGLSLTDVNVTYHESVYQHYTQLKEGGLVVGGVKYPRPGYTNTGYGVSKRRSLANGLNRPERAFFHNGLNLKRCLDAVALAGIVFNSQEPPGKTAPEPKRKSGRWVSAKRFHLS